MALAGREPLGHHQKAHGDAFGGVGQAGVQDADEYGVAGAVHDTSPARMDAHFRVRRTVTDLGRGPMRCALRWGRIG